MREKYIGMIGRGAVGTLFASYIQKAVGNDHFCFIVDEKRKAKYERTPFYLNAKLCDFQYVSQVEQYQPLDILLIVVKAPYLQSSLELVKPFIKEDTIILSLLNGIASEDIVEKTLQKGMVIHSIAQMMDAVKDEQGVTYTKTGEIVLGCLDDTRKAALLEVEHFLQDVQIPHHVAQDILYEQYSKLMLNCAINQICAVYDVPYGACQKTGILRNEFIATMKEVAMIAQLEGIPLGEEEILMWQERLDALSPDAMPSMRQDRLAKRPSEVDLFAKTIIDLASKYGVEVPYNNMYYEKIKAIEATY